MTHCLLHRAFIDGSVRYLCNSRQNGVAWFCLHKLEPQLFGEKPDKEHPMVKAGNELDVLCFALRKHKDTDLPHKLFEMEETVEALSDAFVEHYVQIGKPLSIPTQSLDQIMMGYYRENKETKTITCKLDTREKKGEIDFSYAENISIENQLEMDSRVIVTLNGRATSYDSLMEDFVGDGVVFPDEKWKGEFTKAELPEPAAKKARTEPAALSQSQGSTPRKAGGSTNAVLSDALRKRLAAKGTEKKNN